MFFEGEGEMFASVDQHVGKGKVIACFLFGSEVRCFMVIPSSCSSVLVSILCLICASKRSSWHRFGGMVLFAQVQSLPASGNHMTNVESRTVAAWLHNFSSAL